MIEKIILVGDNYFERVYLPLKEMFDHVILIRYDYKKPTCLQPFMYFFKLLAIYYLVVFFRPGFIIFSNPSYLSYFTFPVLKILKIRCILRIGADLKNDLLQHAARLKTEKRLIKYSIKKWQLKINEKSIQKSHFFFVPSQHVKDCLIRDYKIKSTRIFIIRPVMKPSPPAPVAAKQNIILSVTQFNNIQKALALKDAITHLIPWLQSHPNYQFIVLGDGPYRREIELWAKQKCNALHFKGFINPEPYYQQAKLFLHFSYSDGFPLSVLEAMAHGLPIIANNAVGMKEQVKNGENGFLIDQTMFDQLPQYLNKLIDNADLLARFSSASQAIIQNEYHLEKITEDLRNAWAAIELSHTH
jgi:glycosyltransferase involved in cell wall biosynthesis